MFHNIHAKITCQHAYLITTDIKKFRTCNQSQMRNFVYLPGD